MNRLRGTHPGETATILGLGPSILELRATDFPPGPVITLNHAILRARELGLSNRLYAMQKDGCVPHGIRAGPPAVLPIDNCICPSPRMVEPVEPEHLLLSAAESSHCFPHYPLRHVFDTEADFGVPWNTMSAPIAARIAHAMGCTSILMLGHDAYTRDIYSRVSGDSIIERNRPVGYYRAAVRAKTFAESVGMSIRFA